MSTDIKALPPWKQALLEKKRRHEEDEKRRMADEEDRLSKMPAWKRDILIKKRQLKNSLVFTGDAQGSDYVDIDREAGHTELDTGMPNSSLSPRAVSGELGAVNHFDSHTPTEQEDNMTRDAPDNQTDSGPSEEHIIPIKQNPWLRTELHLKKKHGKVGRPKENDITHGHAVDNSLYHSSCGEADVASGTRLERHDDQENNGDEVFNGEEVEYGRGFVHKLLRKFTHMSAKDEERSTSLKRSNSSENILEEIRGRSISPPGRSRSVSGRVDHARSLSPASPAKARSMENISSHAPNLDGGHLDQRNSLHAGEGHHKLRPVSMGHEVSNHLPSVKENREYNEDFGPHSGDGDALHVEPLRKSHSADNILEDELPRPNTVSAARSLFEHASSSTLSARYTDTLSKRRNSPRSPRSEKVEGSPEGNLSPPQEGKLSTDSSSPSGNLQNGTGVLGKLGTVNHVHDKYGEKSFSDRSLQNIRAAGKSWTFGENSGQEPEGIDTANDRNSNYTHPESNRTSPSAAANNRTSVASYPAYGSQSHSSGQDSTNHSINYTNQNNNIYSNSLTNGPQSEIIETSPEGKIVSPTKKRNAPDAAAVHRIGDKKQGAPLSVEETNEKNRNDLLRGDRLHLNLTGNESSLSTKSKHSEEPRGYRDLYFSSSKRRVSDNSPSYKDQYGPTTTGSKQDNVDSSNSAESAPSYRDLYASKTSPSAGHSLKPHEGEIGRVLSQKEEPIREGMAPSSQPLPEPSHLESNKQEPAPLVSKSEVSKPETQIQQRPIPKPRLNLSDAKPRQSNYVSTISVTEDHTRGGYVSSYDGSEPKRPVETRRTTPVPPLDLSEVTRDRNAGTNIRDKKVKRPAPTGPGKLLIRPASNLLPSGGAQYLDLTKYDDIKSSQMEPAKKRASYFPDDDVPVTNIDDFLGDDVPVTNIDDIAFSPQGSPRMEQDADDLRRELSRKYEFLGAGVKLSKNLLEKTRVSKLRINFNDTATSTYEYPSEQSLLETIPPEPGDFDYPNTDLNHLDNEAEDIIDLSQPGGSLKSTPGMGSGGGLASYKSRYAMDYQFGMDVSREEEQKPAPRRPEPQPTPEDLQITPADDEETYTWSDNATTSDMLF